MAVYSNEDYKKMAEYYQIRSEAFELFYQDRVKYQRIIIIFGGIISQMGSDILQYEAQHGKTPKLEMQKSRLEQLTAIYSEISGLDEKVTLLTKLLHDSNAEKMKLSQENESMKKELESIRELWENLPSNS